MKKMVVFPVRNGSAPEGRNASPSRPGLKNISIGINDPSFVKVFHHPGLWDASIHARLPDVYIVSYTYTIIHISYIHYHIHTQSYVYIYNV
jgi:hypothetical protein